MQYYKWWRIYEGEHKFAQSLGFPVRWGDPGPSGGLVFGTPTSAVFRTVRITTDHKWFKPRPSSGLGHFPRTVVVRFYDRFDRTREVTFIYMRFTWVKKWADRWRQYAKRKKAVRVISQFYFDYVLPVLYNPHTRGRGFQRLERELLTINTPQ